MSTTQTVVMDTNIYISQTQSRRNITNYRIGLNATSGYTFSSENFSDGQTINFSNPLYNFLVITSQFPFNLTITVGSNSVTFACQRFFQTNSPVTSFSITNVAGNGTNIIQVLSS